VTPALPAARWAFVGLVALQRAVELRWSRRNRARLAAAGAVAAPDPIYPAMVAVHAALLLGSALEPWLLARPAVPALAAPALVLFLLAQALRLWALASLGTHWNVRILSLPARSEAPPTAPAATGPVGFVARGPYRFVRHPNYLAVLVEVATLPLITSAWISGAVLLPAHAAVLRRRIRDEERALAAVPGYSQSMGHKPRFVPRLPRRREARAR